MSDQIAAVLETNPFFSHLKPADRSSLASLLKTESYAEGITLFSAGDPGDSMFIITRGTVELFIKDSTGDTITVASLGQHEIFGELSLLDNGPRSATAKTLSEVEVIEVPRDILWSFLTTHPRAALELVTILGQRLRATDELLRGRVSRNLNTEVTQEVGLLKRAAGAVANASGSIPFLCIHIVIFTAWIVWNSGVIPHAIPFDPYPFGFLTMAVSLEAIFLSCLVLLSQNLQAARDAIKNDIEYEVNLKAELEVAELHRKLDALTAQLLGRLERIERTRH